VNLKDLTMLDKKKSMGSLITSGTVSKEYGLNQT